MANVMVLGIGGSLKANSASLAALKHALAGAADVGARTELIDVATIALPMFSPDREPDTAVRQLLEQARAAHGLIWSSPLYHGTISGSFKNALDWLELLADDDPPYLADKVVGLISTAGGTQALQAINTMEFAVHALRAWSAPQVVAVQQAWRAIDAQGRVRDPGLASQLEKLGRQVAEAAERFAACHAEPRATVTFAA